MTLHLAMDYYYSTWVRVSCHCALHAMGYNCNPWHLWAIVLSPASTTNLATTLLPRTINEQVGRENANTQLMINRINQLPNRVRARGLSLVK
jgi:hypothetical protein